MKKFLAISLAAAACVVIAIVSSYCFQGYFVFIVNGVLDAICFLIFQKIWNKIAEKESYKRLIEISTKIKTSTDAMRDRWIEKAEFSWDDMSVLSSNIKKSELSKDDLPLIIVGKTIPNPLTLFIISDIKRQIVWTGGASKALADIEYLASKTCVDEVLKRFIQLISEFKNIAYANKGYSGAENLLETIATVAPELNRIEF